MHIIAVDDEQLALKSVERAIREAEPLSVVTIFTSASAAITYVEQTCVDVAFLDIKMMDMNGLELAKRLKDVCPSINIIFATGHSQYALDAFSVAASGYLMKPVTAEDVAVALTQLRNPVVGETPPRVKIRCFGSFGVFVYGKPLLFSQLRAKEMLAYLVHKRGVAATTTEVAMILWEDRSNSRSLLSQTRTVTTQLRRILESAGIDDILLKDWNSVAIDVDKVSCDYYSFLKGDVAALNSYMGEYMNDYSWAEFTVANLNRKTGLL